jgi:hypothetical protein
MIARNNALGNGANLLPALRNAGGRLDDTVSTLQPASPF